MLIVYLFTVYVQIYSGFYLIINIFYCIGWLKIKEFAYSKVEEDEGGLFQLTRTVFIIVLGQDMSWHIQV